MATLAAAFAAGLLGSAHCLGMCAGISGLFAMKTGAASLRPEVAKAVAYNMGRLLSYALLGVAVALLGRTFVDAIPAMAAPLRFASGLLIMLVGLQIAFQWRILAFVESAGASLWRRIAPAATGLIPVTSVRRALGLGLIWGLLPCGLVYSMLLIAATSAQLADGALIMLAFGLGTTPAMILTGLSAARISMFANRNRVLAGLLIVAMGIATIMMPLSKLVTQHAH
jgi:sulfite exporter TauE/SafE